MSLLPFGGAGLCCVIGAAGLVIAASTAEAASRRSELQIRARVVAACPADSKAGHAMTAVSAGCGTALGTTVTLERALASSVGASAERPLVAGPEVTAEGLRYVTVIY